MIMGIDALKDWSYYFLCNYIFSWFPFCFWSCKPSSLNLYTKVEGDPVLEVDKKMGSTGSAVTLVSLERKDPSGGGCSTSYVVMQLFWKLKSLWKQALGWQRMNVQYSYDIHSYSLNFDDGSFLDHRLHNSC